ETQSLMDQGQRFVEVADRGGRRVVATPAPDECLDRPAADALMDAGFLAACSGRGGTPTIRERTVAYIGVEAVIDKDLTAALSAAQVKADRLIIATDVDSVVADWGTPHAKPIDEVTAAEMRSIAADQGFAAGSMGPKVEAVTSFAEST